jgi:NAD(P)-dependent dehydrogenase (short-subunit alcohol dehydrogenase family)
MANVDMSGKTVLITGGNAGIGKQATIMLAKLGAQVVFTARDLRKGDVARGEAREAAGSEDIDCMSLDLASFASIERFAEEFLDGYPRLDVLVLNAGLILDERSETEEGFETTFGVNHLGHFYLTSLLRERLVASAPARVVVVASDAHKGAPGGLDFDDLMRRKSYGGWKVYCQSKLANILFARELGRKLEGTGMTANALHPGLVRTRFARDGDLGGPLSRLLVAIGTPFMISPEQGAQTTVYVATAPELEGKSGGYYAKCRPAKSTRAARDDRAAARLWTISEELIAKALEAKQA